MKTLRQQMKAKLQAQYQKNKSSKVGDTCICPSCGQEFNKTNYQQAFCKSKSGTICKDYYWNFVTYTKFNNTTRISPANASFMAEKRAMQIANNSVYGTTHPFEGLNDEDYKNF